MVLVTTNTGVIPEIFGPQSSRLVEPGDAAALAEGISGALGDRPAAERDAPGLREHVASHFSQVEMVGAILEICRPTQSEAQGAVARPALGH